MNITMKYPNSPMTYGECFQWDMELITAEPHRYSPRNKHRKLCCTIPSESDGHGRVHLVMSPKEARVMAQTLLAAAEKTELGI